MSSLRESPLIIIGMHRSGTSLVASMLQSAGLHLGDDLMPAKENDNARGFFENIDFVRFHERVLEAQKQRKAGWTTELVSIPEELSGACDQLLRDNQKDRLWGWKDPRTTLFLDFWSERLPDARFLCVFRPPWDVVDSLFRRGDRFFMEEDSSLAVKVWAHYNRLVLDFCARHPSRSILVSLSGVLASPGRLIEVLEERLSIELGEIDADVFEKKLLQSASSLSDRAMLVRSHFPEEYELYQRLCQASLLGAGEADCGEGADQGKLVMDLWRRERQAERELKKTSRELYEARSELYHAREELEGIKRSRLWKLRCLIRP